MTISPESFKDLLKQEGLTVVAAESITAGLFASTIASVPGASTVLKGSVVTYNVDMKMTFLGVKESTLKQYTAESMETTREMVDGLRKAYSNSSIYIAVTGVASPGTPEYPVEHPVGTIFVCIWMDGQLHEFKERIDSTERNVIRQGVVKFMLEQIWRLVEQKKTNRRFRIQQADAEINGLRTFYDEIDRLEEIHWNYYFKADDNSPLDKPFVTDNPSERFMRGYFNKGGKDRITKAFHLETFGAERADHTVAVFFFGALLLKNTVLGQRPWFEKPVDKWYDFNLFIWFVTCLAHDAAFYREQYKDVRTGIITTDQLCSELRVEHQLLEQVIADVPSNLLACVKPYFAYRRADDLIDHGIYAGILAYDVLVKNRKEKQSDQGGDSLDWANDLDPYYASAAATIATHNIWLPGNEQTKEVYEQFGLDALNVRDKVSFSEGPLLYFLGLIDTIDPVKAYKTIPVLEVLKNIHIAYARATFTLTVSGHLDPAILHKKAKDAEKWLNVGYTEHDNGVTIAFHVD